MPTIEPTTLDGHAVLTIPKDEPEMIFPNDLAEAERIYKALMRKWHPDHVGGDEQVAQHVNNLYDLVREKIEKKAWCAPQTISLRGTDGKERVIRYVRRRPFELGEMTVGHKTVCYIVRSEFKDLFDNAVRTIKGFKYATPEMRKEIERYLPHVLATFETTDKLHVMVLAKTPDVYFLRDLMERIPDVRTPRHIAWIGNAFFNICAYMSWAGITHNAINVDTCLLSPRQHSGLIYGGWWYATPNGKTMVALPEDSIPFVAPDVLSSLTAGYRTDLALVRAMLRELLGDRSGTALKGKCPDPMLDFLRTHPSVSMNAARDDYREWGERLKKAFGPRRFIEMNVSDADVYGKAG